jgi:histidinol-phosphatase (PHP family)
MLATYHNHSEWSDGKGTLDDLLEAAIHLGIHELGISDHYVLHPSGRSTPWAMHVDELGEYVAAVQALRKKSESISGPVVRLGLEVDWFTGHETTIREVLSPYPFDYLIGSVHEVDGFVIDASAAAWNALDDDEREQVHRRYWMHMKKMAESGMFDIAAHLDLTKKFGFFPKSDMTRELDDALDAIAAAELVVEINTNGWHKPCQDAYPTLEILRKCRERDIPVTISADAHNPEYLVRDFAAAAERLKRAGYEKVARFADRAVTFEPVDAAVTKR